MLSVGIHFHLTNQDAASQSMMRALRDKLCELFREGIHVPRLVVLSA